MKSPPHWISALVLTAWMPLPPSGASGDFALTAGSQLRAASLSTIDLAPPDPLVKNRPPPDSTSDVPADIPRGNGATVTPVSVERAVDLRNATLSTFHVTFAPGGSVVLHRAPSRGYVLVHVLSGAITAWAWEAEVGIYRSGETWAEPAFADDIGARNATVGAPAEALVVVITEDAR